MVRFDWYTATTEIAAPEQLLALFHREEGGRSERQVRASAGGGFRVLVLDSGGDIGSVQWEGILGGMARLDVWGEATPAVVDRLRLSFSHKVSRVDSCADFDSPGAFDRLLRAVRLVKKSSRLVGEKRGDWDDHPELGRTQTMGSPKSVTMLRLYEKGKHPDFRHLNREHWARLELQVRPKGAAKGHFSKLSALDVWGASPWSREVSKRLLQAHVDPHPAGTTYKRSQENEKTYWMLKQYGNHLRCLYADCGSWELVGRNLGEALEAASQSQPSYG